jgi:hypothetical protein
VGFRTYVPAAGNAREGQAVRTGKGRILLMDDEFVIRMTAERLLARLGYESVTAADGRAAPRADYLVMGWRGFDYEIPRSFGRGGAATQQRLQVSLPRVVDTTGWVSVDFHVHGPNSVDSGLDYESRVRSFVAEGVEVLNATDHDHITDYGPTIRRLGLDYWVKSQMGVEVSPLDYGHFIGFPLRFDQNLELGGAFHWRAGTPNGDWENVPPGTVFKKLRELGSLGPDKTVVFVAHFYDHFTFYGIDPWTLEMPLISPTAIFNPVLSSNNFSGEFDALEAMNGKNYDILRRPTYQEVQDYNVSLTRFLESSKGLPYDEKQRRWGELSAAAQREFMRRTPEEQKTALSFNNPSFACRCTQDSECGEGWLCDQSTASCVAACSGDGACDPEQVAAGREKCLPTGPATPGRTTCQRVSKTCTADDECGKWGSNAERCLASDAAKPGLKTCELPCTADLDCKADSKRPVCDTSHQICGPISLRAARPTDPCPTLRGTLDDWFQLLNHGVRRPILGNSDSHGSYGSEPGLPRTYVQVDGDQPQAVQLEQLASQVKAMRVMPTYGPFVEVSLDDQPVGSVVKLAAGGSVRLRIRVQSPTWFDVDRLEIYRNGELVRVIEGRVGCAPGSSDCIAVPNRQVVNFDGTFEDRPAQDSWYVVVALGLDGKGLNPVYSSTPVARLGMYELIQRLTPLLPPLRSFRTPLAPSMSMARPFATTSPIWVDVGGDGLTAPLPVPSWASPRDVSSTSAALTQPVSREHDHRAGLERMRARAAEEESRLRGSGLTPEAIQQALDSLRYLGR